MTEAEARIAETTIAANRSGLAEVRTLAEDLTARFSLGRSAGLRLNLILEELVTNTITHGGADAESPIVIRMRRTARGVALLYVDRGRPFDPTRASPAEALGPGSARRPGGYGLVLVRGFCRRIRFRRWGDANLLWFRLR